MCFWRNGAQIPRWCTGAQPCACRMNEFGLLSISVVSRSRGASEAHPDQRFGAAVETYRRRSPRAQPVFANARIECRSADPQLRCRVNLVAAARLQRRLDSVALGPL
jgi:hypothetical protein